MHSPLPDRRPQPSSRGAVLRAALDRDVPTYFMEAHSGISAKIAAEAGFEAIWASGLSISAAMGLRDRNEASWTQIVETAELIAEAVDVPVLFDGDSGFGDFNILRRVVKKLCGRGIAGVCVEDKLFPKLNSFLGSAQPLAPVREFCGKIRAAKDSQPDPDFVFVARTEALVSGLGIGEALERADAYCDAGADAILIHSKKSTADEVLEFNRRWKRRRPLVIVPTTYHRTPKQVFIDAKFSGVIWANHSLRASIRAMTEVTHALLADGSLETVEQGIASVEEIFDLTDEAEAKSAEQRYT
jgi:phosphoenolpyruvate phosphomutase